MLLVDERDRQRLVVVPPAGETVAVKGERFSSEQLCSLHNGELLVTPRGRRYLLMRPTLEQVVMNMPRQAQVIYPKDQGLLLVWGDVAPGQRVVEVGCGHGALTMTLLRAIGPDGRLTSFDLRPDHLNRTRKNIATYLGAQALERWTPVEGDPVAAGFSGLEAERLFTDIPEPCNLAPNAAQLLVPGGVWCAYVPTALQMMAQVEAVRAERDLCLPQAFESLQRFWHIKPPSLRPKHHMSAHTGFIMVCRRRWRPPAPG